MPPPRRVSLAELNSQAPDAFVALLGGVFEDSPWVAEAVASRRPLRSVGELHRAMTAAVADAPREQRLALIRAHPDLAGRAAIAGELGPESSREQAAAGLDRLTPDQHARFVDVNARYRERYGFPLVICAREHDAASLLAHAAGRLDSGADREEERALAEIAKIARLRLEDLVTDPTPRPAHISYGKLQVPVHRVHPEHGVLAFEADLEVLGRDFLPAYTDGDNTMVVATDTMKNVILRRAAEYEGTSLEGYADFLGRAFLEAYPIIAGVRVGLRELPFEPLTEKLFRLRDGDHAVVDLELERGPEDDGIAVAEQRSGIAGLQLLKTTGSAFTRFARDADTTLPERSDRPLLIHLDVFWTYADPAEAARAALPPAAIRAVVEETFDRFVSESIQHIVHEMGQALLARFAQLASVELVAENHTHDPVGEAPDGRKVYSAPFPAYGLITLVLER
jgi:urate oxidase / 2-oxo-4-hydroxy-4-carboxy-5-ureidoimidazoline decarboxylase